MSQNMLRNIVEIKIKDFEPLMWNYYIEYIITMGV